MQLLATFLLSASLAAAAPVAPFTPRYPDSGAVLHRMSNAEVDAIYKTCWNGQLKWPLGDTPAPVADVVSPQLSIYGRPAAKPNTLTIHNYCGYDIYYNHFAGPNNIGKGTLVANGVYESPLSGTVFKASKNPSGAKDLLIEYNVAGDGNLWYNLSLITCLGETNGLPNSDTSACAGHEGGLQLGNTEAKSFQCAAGKWCDDQAYLYQENLCKKQNPVFMCKPSLGLTMEFCASKKPH